MESQYQRKCRREENILGDAAQESTGFDNGSMC